MHIYRVTALALMVTIIPCHILQHVIPNVVTVDSISSLHVITPIVIILDFGKNIVISHFMSRFTPQHVVVLLKS